MRITRFQWQGWCDWAPFLNSFAEAGIVLFVHWCVGQSRTLGTVVAQGRVGSETPTSRIPVAGIYKVYRPWEAGTALGSRELTARVCLLWTEQEGAFGLQQIHARCLLHACLEPVVNSDGGLFATRPHFTAGGSNRPSQDTVCVRKSHLATMYRVPGQSLCKSHKR